MRHLGRFPTPRRVGAHLTRRSTTGDVISQVVLTDHLLDFAAPGKPMKHAGFVHWPPVFPDESRAICPEMFRLVLVAAAVAVSSGLQPIADAPYLEVISSRMTCNDGGAAVGPWSVAPVTSAANKLQPVFDPAGFLVFAENGAWLMTLPVNRSAATPGMTTSNASLWQYPAQWAAYSGLPAASVHTDFIVTDKDAIGSVVAVVHGGSSVGSASIVTCSSTLCKTLRNISASVAFGVVHDVAVSWSSTGEPEFWVACDAGLVFLSSASTSLLLDATDPYVGGAITSVAYSASIPQASAGNMYHIW